MSDSNEKQKPEASESAPKDSEKTAASPTPARQSRRRSAVMFLHTLTPLHMGAGSAGDVVDLEVQREVHTGWPTAFSSGLKGGLRSACREAILDAAPAGNLEQANDDPELKQVFGPAQVNAGEIGFRGALTLCDARVLAFPVRSMHGVFAWITCPAVLERFRRDLALAGCTGSLPEANFPGLEKSEERLVAMPDASPVALPENETPGREMVLEDCDFHEADFGTADSPIRNSHRNAVQKLIDWLKDLKSDQAVEPLVSLPDFATQRLVVISDEHFTHFTRSATGQVARNRLNYETKTVERGALFSEEFVPPETLFYSVATTLGSHQEGGGKSADNVLKFVSGHLASGVLEIGGDSSLGRGQCQALWCPASSLPCSSAGGGQAGSGQAGSGQAGSGEEDGN